MGTDVQFTDYEIYHVAMETAVGVLTGMGMPVLPGTAEEKWFMNIMTLFGFLFTTYATARFIELCNRSVAMSAEMTSRTSTIDDVTSAFGLPASVAAQVQYYLNTRFSDVLEQRKFPERTRLLEELPPLLREQVFSLGYASRLRRHRFFGSLIDTAVSQLCVRRLLAEMTGRRPLRRTGTTVILAYC